MLAQRIPLFMRLYLSLVFLTDQSSILRFIEGNWGLGRIGNQSLDAKAGSLMNMFNFTIASHHADKLFLDPSTGLQNPSTVIK